MIASHRSLHAQAGSGRSRSPAVPAACALAAFLLGAILFFPLLFATGGMTAMASASLGGQPATQAAAAVKPPVYVAYLSGEILPISARYINRVIETAEENQAGAVVIMLDTPGGDYTTTQNIVTAISNSRVPVVVYVAPAGGWAGSAGTFITLSANVAAMAPGSRIGAAHPVIEGNPIQSFYGQSPTDTNQNIPDEKITEDAAAWARSLAETHGRNPEAAELTVTQAKSYSDSEALSQHLIDLQANDLPDLFQQLQGRTVTLSDGSQVVLQTAGAPVVNLPTSGLENFLQMLSDPNMAYLLLILGMAALLVEIYHPGAILPGVVGSICMLLGLYALGTLNAYWGGILLIILAFGFFVAEAFTFTHGALGAGGVISLVIGSMLLFSNQTYGPRVSIWLITITALLYILLLGLLITLVVRGQRRPVRTGAEGLLGAKAIARTDLNPAGTVFVSGELWNAVSETGNIPKGTEVVITKVEGLRLKVRSS